MKHEAELWGLNLHTTGLIIGWMCFAVDIIQCILIVYYIPHVPEMAEKIAQEGDIGVDRREAEETVKAVLSMTLCIYLLFVLIDMAVALLLIIGIHKESKGLLIPWLINNVITLTTRVYCSIYLFVFCLLNGDSPHEALLFIAFHAVTSVISILPWVLVWELYLYFDEIDG